MGIEISESTLIYGTSILATGLACFGVDPGRAPSPLRSRDAQLTLQVRIPYPHIAPRPRPIASPYFGPALSKSPEHPSNECMSIQILVPPKAYS